jgi:hypothetical protein
MDTLLTGKLLYLTVAWGIITAVLILLFVYRRILTSKEEGKGHLYLDGAEEVAATEEREIAARLLRLSKPIIGLTVTSVGLLLVITGLWISQQLTVALASGR